MGRDALPASIAKAPIIGVAAGPLGTICFLVVVRAWMMAKSPRIRMITSCSRIFLTEKPRPICARKALWSMKVPSGWC